MWLTSAQALLEASPNITALTMDGEIARRYSYIDGSLGESQDQLLKVRLDISGRIKIVYLMN